MSNKIKKFLACASAGLILSSGLSFGSFENSKFEVYNTSISAYAVEYTYTYYPACKSSYTSIVDALKSIGVDSSKTNRTAIAKLNGISNYTGTASQNTKLLNLLKQGKLIKSKKEINNSIEYYPKCLSSYTSIVDALKSIGVDSSKTNRTAIAKLNGIPNYTGTASQNTKLLNLLKQGKLIKSKNNPSVIVGEYIINSDYNVSVSNKAKENKPHYEGIVSKRTKNAYNVIINQFNVATNSRYKKDKSTYCNIFAWDVMSAMNVKLPHWVKNNVPASSTTKGATELNANATYNWLKNYGTKYGWKKISAYEAQQRANKGYPTVAIWKNPNAKRSGHVMVVRPEYKNYKYSSSKGPVIAQAGSKNLNYTYVKSIMGSSSNDVAYYTNN